LSDCNSVAYPLFVIANGIVALEVLVLLVELDTLLSASGG